MLLALDAAAVPTIFSTWSSFYILVFIDNFFSSAFCFKWIRWPASDAPSFRTRVCWCAFHALLYCTMSLPAMYCTDTSSNYMLNVRDWEWIFGIKAEAHGTSIWGHWNWCKRDGWLANGGTANTKSWERTKQTNQTRKKNAGKKRFVRRARVNVLNAYLARNSRPKATHTESTWKSNRKTLNINFSLFICAFICTTNKWRLCALRVMRDSCAFFFFWCCCCCYLGVNAL